MRNIVDGYFHLLKALIALCLAAMVVLVFGNVVLRYLFNQGITLSEELSRWFFVYLVFLGAVVAMREHGHLGVDILVNRLPAAGRRVCVGANRVLMLGVTWLLLKGSWQQTEINLGATAPASGLSLGIFYASGIVFSVSVGCILLHDLYRLVRGEDISGPPRDEHLAAPAQAEAAAREGALKKEPA